VYEVLSEEDDDSSISSRSSESGTINAGEVLKDLQNMEGSKGMKWKEKADVLIKLGKAVKANPKVGRSWCEGALNYIQDIITSANNVNIHVLRSGALLVFDKVGQVLEDELPIHIAWRTIMIELLKLLKSKQWGGGVRDILQKLHGKFYTVTLANLLTAIIVSYIACLGSRKINEKKSNANSKCEATGASEGK
jgi:hypothetical protein